LQKEKESRNPRDINEASGGSRENIWGAWPLIIWEATTAKRNYYKTNKKFGGLGKIWGAAPSPSLKPPLQ